MIAQANTLLASSRDIADLFDHAGLLSATADRVGPSDSRYVELNSLALRLEDKALSL